MFKKYKIYFLGIRAESFATQLRSYGHKVKVVEKHEQVKKCDICLVSGYYRMIPKEYLEVPKFGFIGFHETELPKGRGCAPLNWTLIKNKEKLVVTMFKIVEEMDEGDWLTRISYKINIEDNHRTLRKEANRMIEKLLEVIFSSHSAKNWYDEVYKDFESLFDGAGKQEGKPTYYRKRKPKDSKLSINKPIKDQWNLIRACDEGYLAFFRLHGRKYVLKEVE